MAVCVLGKDVQNDRSAVNGGTTEQFDEIGLLRRRQFVVENDGVCVVQVRLSADLGHLAFSNKGGRIGGFTPLYYPGHGVGTSGVDKSGQLIECGFCLLG